MAQYESTSGGTCNNVVTVTVTEPGSLGLRLSDALDILGFVAANDGSARAIESSGRIHLGDRLLRVNDKVLTDVTLSDAVDTLTQAALPKVLTFSPHASRCAPMDDDATVSGTSSILNDDLPGVDGVGYVILATVTTTASNNTRLMGYLQGAVAAPGCYATGVTLPQPSSACQPLTNDVKGHVVFIDYLAGCPMHVKALHVQEAGGVALILTAPPQTQRSTMTRNISSSRRLLLSDATMLNELSMPVILLPAPQGRTFDNMIFHPSSSHTTPPRVRFSFSMECLARDRLEDQLHVTEVLAGQQNVADMSAGILSLSSSHRFDFVKPSWSGSFGSLSYRPVTEHTVRDLTRLSHPLHVSPCSSSSSTKEATSEDALKRRLNLPRLTNHIVISKLTGDCTAAATTREVVARGGVALILATQHPTSPHPALLLSPEDTTLPLMSVSATSFDSIQILLTSESNASEGLSIQPADALLHHWTDLTYLAEPKHWPVTEKDRKKLFYRVNKTFAMVDDGTLERQSELNVSFEAAQEYHLK